MTKSFRLQSPRIRESDRQAQIIDWLRIEQAQGRVSWFCRVNGGGVKTATQFIRFYALYLLGFEKRGRGYADIHGMLKGGRYFALEVKQPGEEPTMEQLQFLATVKADGGLAEVVYGFECVARLFGRGSSDGRAVVVAGSSPALGSNQSRMSATTEGAPLRRNDAAPGALC